MATGPCFTLSLSPFPHVRAGKVGTDIQEGKCTWLIVEALARADEETKAALARAYGRDDPSAVADVKDAYLRLGLPSIFEGACVRVCVCSPARAN